MNGLNTLTSLRRQKDLAVDRMDALNAIAKKDGRDLSEIEQLQFDLAKQHAENLADCVHELEGEVQFGAPAPAPEAELTAAEFVDLKRAREREEFLAK